MNISGSMKSECLVLHEILIFYHSTFNSHIQSMLCKSNKVAESGKEMIKALILLQRG